MATVKKPPKAPAKAAAAPAAEQPAVAPVGGGTDPAPNHDDSAKAFEAAKPLVDPTETAKVDQAIGEVKSPEPDPAAVVKAPKVDKHKADVDTALDRLGKIESEAIRMGGDSGQAIRQLACEAMVALGFK